MEEILNQGNAKVNKIILVPSFVNTYLFSEAANCFLKNGYYTNAPEGTFAYQEYWDEQDKRCKEGYSVGGVHITGEHYAYLNFARIKVTTGEGKHSRKHESFPRFLDMDYYYYHELERAKNNREGMIIAKSRRKGFSYKGAFNCVYEYNWYRDSFNIIAAFLKDYCQATMNMAIEMLNFINKYTAWGKRKLIDKRDQIKSGFKETINGIQVESGYKSEIVIISFKDDPFKSIGKSASIMLFEESGKWRGLIEAYMLSKPLFSDGDLMTGIPIIYGTGGDMEDGTQDFAEMFYSPRAYNLRAFENIYDENTLGECGWFVDDMWFKLPHVDKDGNSDRKSAERELDLQRELTKKKSSSKKAMDVLISQHPKTPKEAFLRTKGEFFPTRDLQGVLARLELDPDYERKLYKGFFTTDDKGNPVFTQDNSSKIIYNYPLKKEDNTDSPVIIYEQPFQYEDESTPPGLYIGMADSYDHDQSGTGSLGSCFIINKLTKRIVAEYTARPQTSKHFYEQVRRLLLYYNARMLYESNNKGIFDYFEGKNCLYLLCTEPTLIQDLIKRPSPTRKFGCKMNDQIKRHCENLLYNYLIEEIDDQSSKQNLHNIKSIGLLKELIQYDGEKNTDRVSALFMGILQLEEERRIIVNIERNDSFIPFHKRGIFARKSHQRPN